MSKCAQCEHNGYRYEFSTLRENFNLAQQNCANDGGTLARYLDEDAYLKLRKCCSNGLKYRIGLFENRSCSSSPVGPYSWVGDAACTSGSPLNIMPLQNSAQYSQAVTILLNSNNLARPPDATERFDYESVRYICQYPSTNPTTIVTTSNTPTTRALTSASTTFQQSNAETIATSSTRCTTTDKNPLHNISYAAFIGIIIGMAVLICLLAGGLALYCYRKKRHSTSNSTEITENHVTFKLSESNSQENEEPIARSNHCK